MQITYRIYSDELDTFAPADVDVHRWARDIYTDTLRKELEARWQEAEVEVYVIPRTSGYGSGPVVTDDEGAPLDDIAIEVREIANRVLERLSQAPAGQAHETVIGAPGYQIQRPMQGDPQPDADPVVSEHRSLAAAQRALARQRRGAAAQGTGAYSRDYISDGRRVL